MLKNETITPVLLEGFLTEYDKIYEELLFVFPYHIKMKVIRKYQGTKSLPNSLNFLATTDATSDIVQIVQNNIHILY
jgi:hypothetical protein